MPVLDSNDIRVDVGSDFSYLVALAKKDPEKFNVVRQKIICDFIASCDLKRQERLACFQWRIDETRKQAANPMDSVIKISKMMWDSLDGLSVAQTDLLGSLSGRAPPERKKASLLRMADYKKTVE